MKKAKRFSILLVVGLFIIALCFSATSCKKGGVIGDDASGDDQTASIKLLYIWPEHQTTMNKTINMFMEKNPGITVEASVVPYSEVDKVLQTQIAGGTTPDVFFQWTHQMQKWVELGAALDLTPYMQKDLEWQKSFSNTSSWDYSKFDKKYYNMPFRATEFIIGYNKPMFDSNGWKAPQTLQEFEALMEKISIKGITPFACFGRPGGGTVAQIRSVFLTYLNIQSGITADPNYKTGRLTPEKDMSRAIRATEKAKIWLKKGWLGSNAMGISREDAQNAFINEKAAMFLFNNNEMGILTKGLGKEIGVFPFPSPKGVEEKYVFGGFDGFCASSTTEYPEASVKLLKFLSSKEVQQLWADNEKSVMVNKNVTYSDPKYTILADAMKYAGVYDTMSDFSMGEYTSLSQDLTSQYFQQDTMTAKEFMQRSETLGKQAIDAAGKKYIEPQYTKKTFDDSWLDTVK